MFNSESIKPKLALVMAVTLWASAFVGIRAGLQSYTPGALALLRFIVALACMILIGLTLPKRHKILLQDKCLLMLIGAVGLGCYNIALNYGELYVPSGIASFIISQSPIITAIFSMLILQEAFNFFVLIGMFISVTGVGLIVLSNSTQLHFQTGFYYVLIATIIGGFFSVLQKPFLKKYHIIEITAYIILGSTLSLIFYFPQLIHEIKVASLHSTLATIYLGIFPASVAYTAWNYGLKEVPASKAVSYLYFMPIISALLGWLWLGETLTWVSLLGGAIALFGVWVVNRSHRIRAIMPAKAH